MKQGRLSMLLACSLMMGTTVFTSCADRDDDVLTGQPDWLGNSIYERLEQDGNYPEMLRLIDDMGQHETMSKTGSRTLFAANHDAFTHWFETNTWGARKYEDLTPAQKKLLFNNAVIPNAYLIELLSNVQAINDESDPQKGMCMRRETLSDPTDSIPLMLPSQMPKGKYWDYVRSRSKGIRIMKDNTKAPMIHFLPAFMRVNNITSKDLEILTNGVSTSIEDAWVDGQRVEETDITCKNGYIQKVAGVIESAPNISEILHNHPWNMSKWTELMDRFSAPYYVGADVDRGIDSLFVLHYFTNLGPSGTNNKSPDVSTTELGKTIADDCLLNLDPAWNTYYEVGSSSAKNIANDCAAMFVPSNSALNYWWDHDGSELKEKYGTWDNLPDNIVAQLINVNLKSSFVATVPSKFGTVLDDAKMELGLEPQYVDSCFMGCNGVVYLMKRVFPPRAFSSVAFPAMVHQDIMRIINWAINDVSMAFGPYLNSMDTRYSLFLPTNTAMLRYVDPTTFGETDQLVYEFGWDDTNETVKAALKYYRKNATTGELEFYKDLETTVVAKTTKQMNSGATCEIRNRLSDLLNQLIIVGNVEDGHKFYKSKGGAMVQVSNAGNVGSMTVSGGYQNETNMPITIINRYDKTETGNGIAYLINDGLIEASSNSLYEALSERPTQMGKFLELLQTSSADSSKYNMLVRTSGSYRCPNYQTNYNLSLFEKYNYTVYVPTNESIQKLIDDGYLPTWTDFEAQDEDKWSGDEKKMWAARAIIRSRIQNFLKYHIQDNSVYIGSDQTGTNRYETAKLNHTTQKFVPLEVTATDNSMTIGYGQDDAARAAQKRNVVTTDQSLYNIMCRERWISGVGYTRMLGPVSDVVVHLIDGPLFFDNSLTSKTWEQQIKDEVDPNFTK